MTPESQARKIADIYCASSTHKTDEFCPLRDIIADALREADAEGYRRGRQDLNNEIASILQRG